MIDLMNGLSVAGICRILLICRKILSCNDTLTVAGLAYLLRRFVMKAFSNQFSVSTRGKGTYEVTSEVSKMVRASGIQSGTATVFVQHTSCSIIIMENADPSARTDLHAFFDHLVPEDTPYFVHTYEGSDDMPSHIRMCLTDVDKSVPVADGRLALGTWQGIFLFEHRRSPHTRNVVVNVMGT